MQYEVTFTFDNGVITEKIDSLILLDPLVDKYYGDYISFTVKAVPSGPTLTKKYVPENKSWSDINKGH